MILTVTLNTGIDRVLVLPGFDWNHTIRAETQAVGMGGKGIGVSWVLGELGIPTTAIGFAAGQAGLTMQQMLEDRNVQSSFIWVNGETRTNTILINTREKCQSTITSPGPEITSEQLELFLSDYQNQLNDADCVVIGGSIPSGVPETIYRDLVLMAKQRSLPVILDSSGAGLRHGIQSCPAMIKPNQDELQELTGKTIRSKIDAAHAAKELGEKYQCKVIVTLGKEGAVAAAGGSMYSIDPLDVRIKNTAGAGDAVVAGLAHSISRKLPFEEGLRWGFAAAAAVMLTLPTAGCHKKDVLRHLPEIQIRPLSL